MRGIGSIAAAFGAAFTVNFRGYQDPFRPTAPSRIGYGTGWKRQPFQHPEGPCSFRPTGNKRPRRRAAAKSGGR